MAKESIINRVQKLLNLAMDQSATEDERKLAQERADALMAQHMIDQMDLKPEDPSRSRVTSTKWEFFFEFEFAVQLKDLLAAVVRHATCRATSTRRIAKVGEPNMVVTIVGTPENIAYAERLWMVVFTELTRNMFPKVDPNESFDRNVYNFVKAGFKWQEIHELLWRHKDDPRWMEFPLNDPYPPEKQSEYSWHAKVYGGDGGRLKRAYTREVKRLGESSAHHTTRHGVYRRSYVQSYSSTISLRLHDMRSKSEDAVSDRDKFALAVRSSQDEADAEFYRLFPQFDPENIRKQREEMLRQEQIRWQNMTPEERARAEKERLKREERARKHWEKTRDKSYDQAGWARGSAVAKKVNLNDDTQIHHSKKEIG
ncbi:hypothetical protein PLotp47 [Mycobacterium phage PLot]|uniref:DUF2786 domain-containing protein n=5 Tax=Plotvirus plot TaxID=2170099 RepID=Q19YA2_9CAUD|nr:hypothetical protein PLotp47 [Mycobacterium phage PLot]AVP43143.1 hypothetical protein PBI_BIGMAMA_45 [Mycobacterium phage BigMama]AWY03489.1 hypothetical protein ERK16_46 [Mycobacterium phage Erk16]QBI97113.1 hypothetical protein SEA_CHILL_49 [Mycobacterium phage Chill]QBP30046.1 hypothetical protein SEA_WALDOWHY_49 [Mycobacterium phage WaldoWhy]QOP66007.1 hypothetical protein PBI_THOTH_47 [Mycobacterium phage Thoth]WQY91163.1 hypothetical protein BENZEMA_46 [Mycobacterium phage Benzema]